MSKAAIVHLTAANLQAGKLADGASRQITAVSNGGATVSMGFANKANQDIWLAQNAFWLDEVTSNRG